MQKKIFTPLYLYFLFFVLIINGCTAYRPVQISEIKSIETDISTGQMIVGLRVVNPNGFSIKVKKYNIQAFVNNTNLGKVEPGKKVVLRKNSDSEHKVTFTPDFGKVVQMLPSLILSGRGVVGLKGDVKIKSLFVSRTFPVDLKKKISAKDFR